MTIVGLDLWVALVCVTIAFVGSTLQASIGIGLGLLAAPTLSLVDPDFIPGALVVCVIPLSVGMTVREFSFLDRTGIGVAVIGRFFGSVLGAWIVTAAGQSAIVVIVGLSVLVAVVASATGLKFPTTRRNLAIAGTASGFSGTAAGVGGPPMALTYQNADPRTLRATIATFNTIGSAMTVTLLTIAGVIGKRELQLALLLVPGVVLGLWAARFTIHHMSPARVRPFVLVVCAASATALLTRELL